MIKYFDKKNNRLVCIEQSADQGFWEKHWQKGNLKERVLAGADAGMVRSVTTKYLPKGAKIIEGGCGISQGVYGLSVWGYDSYGVDFAEKSIEDTKQLFPELHIYTEDVRKTHFENNFFDGYWSLGVIEHFWDGYKDVINEAKRVLKGEGYLFVTVPWFSPLRKSKARKGKYQTLESGTDTKNFYEFMLDEESVIKNISSEGFRLVGKSPQDAIKGLKDEINFGKKILQNIYDGKNIFAKGIRFLITRLLAGFSGHIILLVFQKDEKNI